MLIIDKAIRESEKIRALAGWGEKVDEKVQVQQSVWSFPSFLHCVITPHHHHHHSSETSVKGRFIHSILFPRHPRKNGSFLWHFFTTPPYLSSLIPAYLVPSALSAQRHSPSTSSERGGGSGWQGNTWIMKNFLFVHTQGKAYLLEWFCVNVDDY